MSIRATNLIRNRLTIGHLQLVFNKINGYLWWIINQETRKIRNEMAQSNNTSNNEEETPTEVENIESTLMLPYRENKGEKLSNSLFKTISKVEKKTQNKDDLLWNENEHLFQRQRQNKKQKMRMAWCTNTNVNKLNVKQTYIG